MIYAIINIIITNARKSSQCSFYFTVWCKTLNEGSTRFIFYLQCGELEPCWSVLKAFFSSLSSLHITNKNGCVWIPLRICGLMGAYLVWSLRYDLLSFIWSDMRFLIINPLPDPLSSRLYQRENSHIHLFIHFFFHVKEELTIVQYRFMHRCIIMPFLSSKHIHKTYLNL